MRWTILWTISAGLFLSVAPAARAQTNQKELETKMSREVVNGKTMLEWMNDLKERDASVREQAVAMLKLYGPAARSASPQIIKFLGDPDASMRVNAAISLGFIGFEEKDRETGVNALIYHLSSSAEPQSIVRYQAVMALGRLGAEVAGQAAVPKLAVTVRDRQAWEIRKASAWALGNLGWNSQKGADLTAMQALTDALEDGDQEVRYEALLSLFVLGKPAPLRDFQRLEQHLTMLTKDRLPPNNTVRKQSPKVVIWAHMTLMRIKDVSALHLSPIAKYLKDPKAEIRIQAARALATVGEKAKPHVNDLIAALDDKDPNVVVWVCTALGSIGPASQDAVGPLKHLANTGDDAVKRAAQDALQRIGNKKAS